MTEVRKPTLSLLDVATAVVVIAIAILAVWIALRGPTGAIPVHFNAAGEADRYGDRSEVALLMGFMALMAAATAGGMGWALHRTDDPARRRGLALGQALSLIAIGGVTLFMTLTMLGAAEGQPTPPMGWMTLGVSALLIVIGAGLGRVAPNPVIGVRTPWTFKSRLSWDRSNRLAGRLFFWLGLAGLAATPFLPGGWTMTALGVAILVAAAWCVFESWRVWRADPDRQPF